MLNKWNMMTLFKKNFDFILRKITVFKSENNRIIKKLKNLIFRRVKNLWHGLKPIKNYRDTQRLKGLREC